MANQTTDELGLVKENEYIVAFVPTTKKAFIFRVLSRINAGKEEINYGPLPLTASTAYSSLVGTAGSAVANVLPAYAYNTTAVSFAPPSDVTGTFDTTDMWYMKKEYRRWLFHVIMEVTPAWTQIEMEVPKGVKQGRFQNDQGVQVGIGKTFGFARGSLETLFFPELHVGFRFGNDTNINAYTGVKFTYAEMLIAIPTSPELIFDILTQQRPAHWITLPINNYDGNIVTAFKGDYGFEGFPLFDRSQRAEALKEYAALAPSIRTEVTL